MKKNILNSYILLLPWILLLLIFWLYPIVFTGAMSFFKYNTLSGESHFIGLENYKNMFKDEIFWTALRNTFFFTIGTVPATTTLALILANLLNSKLVKHKSFFRSSFFLPAITSLVVISLIFTNLYAQDGYVNFILSSLGLPYPERGWLFDTNTSLPAIMLMDIWSSCGYYMIIILAAMQAVPQSLYDTAKLAGASPIYTLKKITIPMIKPTLVFVLIINIIKSFQVFIEIYIMTKGGPLSSTTTLVYTIFTNAFEKNNSMGYAAAIAYFLFLLLLIISFLQLKIMRKNN